MARMRWLWVGVFALAAAAITQAPAQQAPASADAIGNAIAILKRAPTGTTVASEGERPHALTAGDVDDARAALILQWQQSAPQVINLLSDPNPLIRMNAALVLDGMAQAGDISPAVVDGLQRCVKDSEVGVAFEGFEGLMADGIPAAAQKQALAEVINITRPRALVLAAIPTLQEKKPKAAVPLIIVLLQDILKDYNSQVAAEITAQANPQRSAEASAAARVSEAPSAAGGGNMARRRRAMMEEDEGPRRNRQQEEAAPTAVTQTVTRVLSVQDLNKLSPEMADSWIAIMEKLPALKELHLLGWTLEDIIRTTSPDEKLFGFDSTAPWNLKQCVEKAVIWLQQHKAEYETTPAAPAAPAAAPATPAAAPAASAAAPAATKP